MEEGVLREILKESGVHATVRCLSGIYSNVGQHLFYDGITSVPTKVMFNFLCDYTGCECTVSDETSEVIWVPRKSAMEYITKPVQKFRFKKTLDFTGQIHYCSYVTKPDFKILSSRFI